VTTRDVHLSTHPPLSLLQSYAVGALGPAASIAFRFHAQHCALCAKRLGDLEALGGAFFDAAEDAPFDVDASLACVLAKLREPPPSPPHFPPDVMAAPEELRPAFAQALSGKGWSFAGPGLRSLSLDIPGADANGEQPPLLRIEPGCGAPRHAHGGVELTLVLDGAFRDQTGVYGPGDLAVATDGLTHRPIAEPGRVCLAYAVSHAPMRFTGLLGLAQRLLTHTRR
jgi:putative transcriptional regulator